VFEKISVKTASPARLVKEKAVLNVNALQRAVV
jgi:hypothetical protein